MNALGKVGIPKLIHLIFCYVFLFNSCPVCIFIAVYRKMLTPVAIGFCFKTAQILAIQNTDTPKYVLLKSYKDNQMETNTCIAIIISDIQLYVP